MDAGAREPFRRILDVANDVHAVGLERLDGGRSIRADDVEAQLRITFPENRHHVRHEMEERVLVRRARSCEESPEEEKVAPLLEAGRASNRLDPVRQHEGRRLGSDLRDELRLLAGDGEDGGRLVQSPELDLAHRRCLRFGARDRRRVLEEADHALESSEGERLGVERPQRLRLRHAEQPIEARRRSSPG